MARELKFRVWDEDKKQMIAWQPVQFEENYLFTWDDVNNPNNKMVWMQYTGLKDRNGKEVFEGDKVTFKDDPIMEERPWSVRWSTEDCAFELIDSRGLRAAMKEVMIEDSAEVVGNIYE